MAGNRIAAEYAPCCWVRDSAGGREIALISKSAFSPFGRTISNEVEHRPLGSAGWQKP